jgi:SpoVK/Ycf46/Vps4 family AAA+-type ATPase
MVDLPDHATRKEILQVTLANNRVANDVDFDKLADNLEGYTGSDIKEVCREAVVKISHDFAKSIEQGLSANKQDDAVVDDMKATLRPVNMKDFQLAMKKLKASVSENGRELAKVIEWNAKYGEFKRAKKKPTSNLNLYI